jgi:hypothetical protein
VTNDQSRLDYMNELPEGLRTPGAVETRLGTLEFQDGVPTKETADLLYDNLDFSRAVETFLVGMQVASVEAMRRGLESVGVSECNQVLLFGQLMDNVPLFLTGNSGTVYATSFLDLKRDGPTLLRRRCRHRRDLVGHGGRQPGPVA